MRAHAFRPRWKFLCGVQIAFRAVSSGRRPFVTADSGQATYKPTTLIMTPRRLTTSSSYAHSWSNIHAFTRSSSFSSLSVIVFLTEYIPLCSHRGIPCHLGRTYTTRVHGSLTPTLSVYLNRNNERYRVNAKLIRSNYPLLEVRPSKVTALQMTGCHRCTRSATRIDRLCRCGGENMVFAFRSFERSLALLIQTRPLRTQWNFGLFENNEIFDTMVGRILSELSSCTYSLQRIYI